MNRVFKLSSTAFAVLFASMSVQAAPYMCTPDEQTLIKVTKTGFDSVRFESCLVGNAGSCTPFGGNASYKISDLEFLKEAGAFAERESAKTSLALGSSAAGFAVLGLTGLTMKNPTVALVGVGGSALSLIAGMGYNSYLSAPSVQDIIKAGRAAATALDTIGDSGPACIPSVAPQTLRRALHLSGEILHPVAASDGQGAKTLSEQVAEAGARAMNAARSSIGTQ